jgi:mRNA-degrading endonuclease HigB of HigAB toxin-antitoxin module
MVDPSEFKKQIKKRIIQNYTIEFLGDDFDDICKQISDTRAQRIYAWIEKAIKNEVQPIPKTSDKKYKQWSVYELLTFIHKLDIKGTEYRILFIKLKNSFYIEFHLGSHKYYDKLRSKLDLTKKDY